MRKRILLTAAASACFLLSMGQTKLNVGGKQYVASQIEKITYEEIEINNSVLDEINECPAYSIFAEALKKTGLCDSIAGFDPYAKLHIYNVENPTDRDGRNLYLPKTKRQKYTIFAESNDVLAANGITSFGDLAKKCAEWYGNAGEWYDYIKEKNITISTGNDYTNRFNVVNMFVAYHILKAGMAVDQILYEKNADTNSSWNYCFGYEPQAYFETMLPNTLVKAWELNPKTTKDIYLNRYRKNNTLTDQIATFGSDATHPIIYEGAKVNREGSLESHNGYVHSIDKPLVYDKNAKDALHERMRFDVATILPEIINDGLRFATASTVSTWNNGGDGNRVAFAQDYFDNLKCYDNRTVLRYNVMGAWRALESHQFQGWDTYDYALKLPHVPSGRYELRIIYPPMSRGGQIQYYIGSSSDLKDMQAMGEPLDAIANPYEDPSIGYEDIFYMADDYGMKSDAVMRKNGYMRAPASFSRGTYNTITDKLTYDENDIYSAARQMVAKSTNTSCRTESGYGTMMLRRIIGTLDIKQGEDYWLRIKNLLDDPNLGWSFDFLELVPVDVADSKDMHEDWY